MYNLRGEIMKLYIYHNTITFDSALMDDHIFNELSEENKYPSDEAIASEWDEQVETEEVNSVEELLKWLEEHKLLEVER